MSLSREEHDVYNANVMQALGATRYPEKDRSNHFTPFPLVQSIDSELTVGIIRCNECHEDIPGDEKTCPYCQTIF